MRRSEWEPAVSRSAGRTERRLRPRRGTERDDAGAGRAGSGRPELSGTAPSPPRGGRAGLGGFRPPRPGGIGPRLRALSPRCRRRCLEGADEFWYQS